ncbi:MAG: DNA repair protein RecN [Pyrinomonadaceae bacterium]|nr:DNA repair protein RecN [Pyrinomonadaceae bacterium]
MLTFLKIKNIALIDELQLEFARGLNLLTGETGSGKSIIVDSLGALTGDRVYSELIKEGEESARIEGLFSVRTNPELLKEFFESGVELENSGEVELIVRRELSASGRNRIFVNDQMVTQSFLKKIGQFLVDIHGQGDQTALFDPASHLAMLDEFAETEPLLSDVREKFRELSLIDKEIRDLRSDEAQKLQLIDILQFQVDEIGKAKLETGEDDALEEEKRRLNNVEKLSTLSDEAYAFLYEDEKAAVSTLEKAIRRITELAQYESTFGEYLENLNTAQAVLEDLAFSLRSFSSGLEYSPERLEEIENRLAEIARIKRKYGGTIESALEHFQESDERLKNIETADLREKELRTKLLKVRAEYVEKARLLSEKRRKTAKKFEKDVEANLKTVALEKARFEVRIDSPSDEQLMGSDDLNDLSANGFDRVEFYFSANIGESPKPIAKVASGGEASRLMLVLKTAAKLVEREKAMVFDEVDAGIGGRVAESVGLKLKELAKTQQVLCVTHQPQVASLADQHFVVEKRFSGKKTIVAVRKLDDAEKVEEIARMLAGETISDSARTHAREMLSANS